MSGGVTVIGLTPGVFTIEDIRVAVPYRTAVQIPAHLAQRSKNLGEALQQQRVMQLGNALPLPLGPAKDPPLAPMLRGRGIAPHSPVSRLQDDLQGSWQLERASLLRELETSRAQCSQLQGINEALQVALATMTSQLAEIQQTLVAMSGRPATAPAPAVQARSASETLIDSTVPHYIPATTGEAAEVRISIPENTSDTDLSGARGALRSLRKKSGP